MGENNKRIACDHCGLKTGHLKSCTFNHAEDAVRYGRGPVSKRIAELEKQTVKVIEDVTDSIIDEVRNYSYGVDFGTLAGDQSVKSVFRTGGRSIGKTHNLDNPPVNTIDKPTAEQTRETDYQRGVEAAQSGTYDASGLWMETIAFKRGYNKTREIC